MAGQRILVARANRKPSHHRRGLSRRVDRHRHVRLLRVRLQRDRHGLADLADEVDRQLAAQLFRQVFLDVLSRSAAA